MDGLHIGTDGSDAGVAELIAGRLQRVIGQRLTEEELQEVVLSEILTMLTVAEDEVGHLSPRAGDPRLSARALSYN